MAKRKTPKNPGSRASGFQAPISPPAPVGFQTPVDDGWQRSADVVPNITAAEYAEAWNMNVTGFTPPASTEKSFIPPASNEKSFTPSAQIEQSSPAIQSPTDIAPEWADYRIGWKEANGDLTPPAQIEQSSTAVQSSADVAPTLTNHAVSWNEENVDLAPPAQIEQSSTIVQSPADIAPAWADYSASWNEANVDLTPDVAQDEQASTDTQIPAAARETLYVGYENAWKNDNADVSPVAQKENSSTDAQSQGVVAPVTTWAEYGKKTSKRNNSVLTPLVQNGQSSPATQNSTVVTPKATWVQAAQNGKPATRAQNRQLSVAPPKTTVVASRKNTWAQTAKSSQPVTLSLAALTLTPATKAVKNTKPATPSLPTLAPNAAEHWDTHNEFGNMTKEQIAIAVAAKAVQKAAKDKKDAMDVKLKGWPWKGVPPQLATAGPLYLNTYAYVMEEDFHEQQNCPLIRALLTQGVGELIIDLLFQHHASIWQLAFTCQKAQSFVKVTLGFWDLNLCHFNGCDLLPTPNGDVEGRGLVATNLVISPMRSPDVVELHESNLFYEAQLYNTYKLTLTVKYRAANFRRIHLHRVPFLTTNLLELLIPQMTNLEVLGVYKCPLIHIGHGMDLLHLISVDRPKGKEYQVSLDWYPNFHVGPDEEICPTDYFTGSYGATWDDWHGDTDRGIWALVLPFLSRCKVHGIDAVSTHTQFRRWLEAGPCWDVTNTLKAIVLAWNLQMPGSDLFQGDENIDLTSNIIERTFPSRRLINPVPKSDYYTKFPKLTRAVIQMDRRNNQHFGNYDKFFEDTLQMKHSRPEGYEWRFKPLPCMFCENIFPGICFNFPEIKAYLESTNHGANPNNGTDLICLGCRLSGYLNTEKDHFKDIKRKIMGFWLGLAKMLMALKAVDLLDKHRLGQAKYFGYDREFEERQDPKSAQVLNSLRGDFLGAPSIWSWAQHLADIEEAKINPEMAKWRSKGRTSHLLHVRTHG